LAPGTFKGGTRKKSTHKNAAKVTTRISASKGHGGGGLLKKVSWPCDPKGFGDSGAANSRKRGYGVESIIRVDSE